MSRRAESLPALYACYGWSEDFGVYCCELNPHSHYKTYNIKYLSSRMQVAEQRGLFQSWEVGGEAGQGNK